MAYARLHIICGNCGSNNWEEADIELKGRCLDADEFAPDVYLSCGNCATIHSLSDYMEVKNEKENG